MNIMDQRSLSKTISSLSGLGIALLANTSGFAIGVGEVQVKSALNQPLYATIPITATPSEQGYQDSLRVKLASPEMHQQAGLRYPNELAKTHFDLYQAVNGRTQVLVGTTQAIHEPLVTFLLEVEWSHGRLLKEVSMLLDPPGYQNLPISAPAPITQVAQAKPKPVVVTRPKEHQTNVIKPVETAYLPPVTDISSFDVPVFVEVQASLKVAQLDTESYSYSRPIPPQRRRQYSISSGQYGPVRAGDTLMDIAKVAARGTGKSAKQMAQDIYSSNPEAFSGSIDRLEKGVILYIPDTAGAIATAEPPPQVETHYTAAVSGFSTISDFAFSHPPEMVSGSTTSVTPAPIAESAPVAPSQTLEILPPDETSTQIAQDIAKKLAENEAKDSENAVAKVENTAVSGNPNIPATNASLKSAAGTSTQETARLIVSDPSITPSDGETSGVSTTIESTVPVEKESLTVALETEDLPQVSDEDINYLDTLLKWLPWLLLMVALPIMLLLGLRKKHDPATKIPPPMSKGLDAQVPQRSNNEAYVDHIETTTFRNPEESDEFTSDTTILDRPDPIADFDSLEPELENQSSTVSQGLINSDDLQPSASDTQETIRPTAENDPATQVMEGLDTPVDEVESELDAAQEAEIYLAYGQYSLAESAINRLRDSNQDNARYKLLQLKLYAETGNLDDMHTLAENLLRDAEDNSGLSQQIQKITDRAQIKHGTSDEIDIASPDTSSVSLLDNKQVEDKQPDIIAPLSSIDTGEAETAQLSSAPFVEDIDDYLHVKPSNSALDSLDDPLVDSLSSIQPDSAQRIEPSAEIEEEAFTDAELDAISMELDLMDEPGDAFEISDDLSESYSDDAVENFSDTDYRLTPLGRDDTAGGKSERLDVPFDLESEIEKLAHNKPAK